MVEKINQLEECTIEYKEEQVADLLNNKSSLKNMSSLFYGPAHNITDKLREEGYEISGHSRVKIKYPKYSSSSFMGILKDKEPIQKNLLGILKWKKKQRAYHIGTLWLNHEGKKAKEDKKWVLEVYGKKYSSGLLKIVKELSEFYEVKLEINLASDTPREEVYLHEIGSR
jgi:hypothetical protein